jgi:hypothetical protein
VGIFTHVAFIGGSMQSKSTFGALALLLMLCPAANAQRRFYSKAATSTSFSFQVPTSAELGRTLTGAALPSNLQANAMIADSLRAVRRTCPMLVMTPDSTRSEHMPRVAADTTRRDSIPTLRPGCVNPLRP